MDFNSMLNSAKSKAAQATNGKSDQLIADNLDRVRKLFKTKLGQSVKTIVIDDGKMTEISQFVYGELPLPVRLVVKEDDFVRFCLDNRDKVLSEPG
jgi:hypothetical protein